MFSNKSKVIISSRKSSASAFKCFALKFGVHNKNGLTHGAFWNGNHKFKVKGVCGTLFPFVLIGMWAGMFTGLYQNGTETFILIVRIPSAFWSAWQ